MSSSSLKKCDQKKVDKCLSKGKVCDADSGKCITVEKAVAKHGDDLKATALTGYGVSSKNQALDVIKKYLKKLPKEERLKLSEKLDEAQNEEEEDVSVDESEVEVEESPFDDFGEGAVPIYVPPPVQQVTEKSEIRKVLEKMTAKDIKKKLQSEFNLVGVYKLNKKDAIDLYIKKSSESQSKPVKDSKPGKSVATVVKTATVTQLPASLPAKKIYLRHPDDPVPKKETQEKYRKVTVPGLVAVLKNEYNYEIPLKTRRAVLLSKIEEQEEKRKNIVNSCDCVKPESCNLLTGVCENPVKGTDRYVLIYNGDKQIHGTKESLEQLVNEMKIKDYSIMEAGTVEIKAPSLPSFEESPPLFKPMLPATPPSFSELIASDDSDDESLDDYLDSLDDDEDEEDLSDIDLDDEDSIKDIINDLENMPTDNLIDILEDIPNEDVITYYNRSDILKQRAITDPKLSVYFSDLLEDDSSLDVEYRMESPPPSPSYISLRSIGSDSDYESDNEDEQSEDIGSSILRKKQEEEAAAMIKELADSSSIKPTVENYEIMLLKELRNKVKSRGLASDDEISDLSRTSLIQRLKDNDRRVKEVVTRRELELRKLPVPEALKLAKEDREFEKKIKKLPKAGPRAGGMPVERLNIKELRQVADSQGIDNVEYMGREAILKEMGSTDRPKISLGRKDDDLGMKREQVKEFGSLAIDEVERESKKARNEKKTIPELKNLADIVSGKAPKSEEEVALSKKINDFLGF